MFHFVMLFALTNSSFFSSVKWFKTNLVIGYQIGPIPT